MIPVDMNGNGIADSWEQGYGGDLNPTNDVDRDGHDNFQEYITGTVPTNSESVFMMESITTTNQHEMILHWPAAPGRTYRIGTTTNLTSPQGAGRADLLFPILQTQLTSAKPKLSIISLGILYSKHFLGLLFSNSTAQLN